MREAWNLIVGGGAATVAYLIGGVDQLVSALAIFMACDIITGLVSAGKVGSVTSHKAYTGLKKKVGMVVFVIICNQLDLITGNEQGFLRNAMVLFLIATEGISILENLGRLGVTAPDFLKNALEQLKNKEGK